MSARGSVTVEELRQVANEEERVARLHAAHLRYNSRLNRWMLAVAATLAILAALLWRALR